MPNRADDHLANVTPLTETAVRTGANPDAVAPYEFRQQIARGGMGSILEAADCKLGRTVAVKIMLAKMNADEDQRQRFINEAAVLAMLEHPNIVPIHDLGRDSEGQLYYTMKLVKGRTLQSILNGIRDGETATVSHYTLDRLLTIFRKVCDALAFAHSRQIIHRDLKPENIMVGEFGEVLVMDWGLAKTVNPVARGSTAVLPTATPNLATSDEETIFSPIQPQSHGALGVTMEGTVMGTPQYMSPEQAAGRIAEMDARSDIFSLGGILYAILTLRPPVEGTTLDEVLQKVASGSISPPSRFGGGNGASNNNGAVLEAKKIKPLPHCPGGRVPAALSAVVMKALRVSRGQRYQQVAALSADVEAYQNGFATTAEKAGSWKLFTLFIRRHKAASIGVAAVLVIGGSLGTKAIIEGQRANRALADLKGSAPALLKLAESEADTQHFADALHDMDAVLALDPALARAYWQRAWVLLGMERWSEAADALRLARQRDPSEAKLGDILPAVEKVAATPAAGRWKSAAAREVFAHLQSAAATGPMIAFTSKLKLEAEVRRKLVEQRLTATLGNGNYALSITSEGLVHAMLIRQKQIRSCEPFRGLPLDILYVAACPVENVEPLRGMGLRQLTLGNTLVSDLSPLVGMPLTYLNIGENYNLTELSPLTGMPLTELEFVSTNISDLSPLIGMPLTKLVMWATRVYRIEALRGMPLVRFDAGNTRIADLSPLKGAPLEFLRLENCVNITDLSPLRGSPLKDLRLRGSPMITDFSPVLTFPHLEYFSCNVLPKELLSLRASKTLKTIEAEAYPREKIPGPRAVAEFWKAYDEHQAVKP